DGIIAEAVVEWHRKITVDPERAAELKNVLGKKGFSFVF
ncbi:unnamed protein product, partial [marine sediment metagenome]